MKIHPGWLLACALLFTPSHEAPAQEPSVRMWLSTADRSALVAEQPESLHFSSRANDSPAVEVNDMQQFQTMDGFGFALTGGSAQLLMRMQPGPRADLLKELFGSQGKEDAVSYLRVTIGSSDMNERVYSYDDLPPGQTDANLAHFSLAPDRADVIPVLKQILAINPNIKILGSPWSAPPWMKTNDRVKGGQLKPEYYGAYALYFVKYIQQMKAEGISIAAITVQNEPLNPKNTPSMVMFAPEEDAFIANDLVPAFRDAGLTTRILLYDHNPDVLSYPMSILQDPAAGKFVDGTAFHLYGGLPSALTEVHDAYPNKNLYMTEQSIGSPANEPLPIAASISDVLIASVRNWSRNVLLWNLAADPNDGPHTHDGGCTGCQGAITLDGDQVSRNLAYYAIEHFSRFVPPGSVHIGSTELEQLQSAAFLTPDGKIALVEANTGNFPKTFDVKYHGKWFTTTLPPESSATYVW
ncbi:MAG TPA: glycoside hydrolase family 30 beta sandwich domain-containing protein [Acidobacteriaceae bacterium]|nr:glycoside hydrolase family 30 beta sandwich domain-containing protein [Acidobacteriaceae bacterium]